MEKPPNRAAQLLLVLTAAVGVYVCAHWDALTNPYVINDDVRQQVFWMQQWVEPGLFEDDLLAQYASNYVPWGVQAIYAAAAPLMNPVQFSKVLTVILFVITAGFLFGLGLGFRDRLTATLVVCVFFLFGGFMRKISGGLPMSFGFPLLAAYLFFLGRGQLWGAGVVILIESVINPYIFLLCLVTHSIFLMHNHGRNFFRLVVKSWGPPDPAFRPWSILAANTTVVAGVILMALKYVVYKSTAFGELVTRADMVGKIEYTAAGRYELTPIPSVFYELYRPWVFNLPFREWGPVAGWISVGILILLAGAALTRWNRTVDPGGFRVFAYLFPASLILYALSSILLTRLYIPRRYIEFSLNIFYCMAVAVCLRVFVERVGLKRVAFPLLTAALVILAAVRLHNVGIFDYSAKAGLYRFLESTPKSALMAGNPELMDDVPTFARRRAFVTFELSHTWYSRYWATIKKRTFDFFNAYYAGDPAQIHEFCRKNGINYLIVRESDFSDKRLNQDRIYFEPFDTQIRKLAAATSDFAVLDRKRFPPIYEKNGIRVLKFD